MEKQSHIVIARFVSGYVERQYGIRLSRKSFILGNILPDLMPSFLYRPHFWQYNRTYVQQIIQSLREKSKSACSGMMQSLFMGMLCHLYTDFFCYAHSERFSGGLKCHIRYEKQLNSFLKEHLTEIAATCFAVRSESGLDTASILGRFQALQVSYYKIPPSPESDLFYSILSCVEAIVLISESAETSPAQEELAFLQAAL